MEWFRRQGRGRQVLISCGAALGVMVLLVVLVAAYVLSPFFSFGP